MNGASFSLSITLHHSLGKQRRWCVLCLMKINDQHNSQETAFYIITCKYASNFLNVVIEI